MEEFVELTLVLGGRSDYLVSRYSERKESSTKAEAARLASQAMEHEKHKP